MAKTHYETLGLKRSATAAEIKSAYRKVALSHHPDRSKDPRSGPIFLAATEAYDVLSDRQAKLRYDASLDSAEKAAAEKIRMAAAQAAAPRPASPPPGWTSGPRIDSTTVASDIQRLTQLYARGQHAEAEKLARQIAHVAPKHPVVYAVLGDIARQRGDLNEAAKMYAYAAQFEPSNPVYQRRYEELLNSTRMAQGGGMRTVLEAEDHKVPALFACGVVLLACSAFLAFNSSSAAFAKLAIVSSWTWGMPVTLFLGGISVGACLAMGNMLDRFASTIVTATGRASPTVALGLVAVVNFWAAALLYVLLGAFQRAFNFSTTRVVVGVAGQVLLFSFVVAVSHRMDGLQVLAWGGNIAYLGALVGWLVADAFRV